MNYGKRLSSPNIREEVDINPICFIHLMQKAYVHAFLEHQGE